MILGDGVDGVGKKDKRGKYGTLYERMTSPGREYLREYVTTPDSKMAKTYSKDDKILDNNILNGKYEEDKKGDFEEEFNKKKSRQNLSAENSKVGDIDNSFKIRKTLTRVKKTHTDSLLKVGIDKLSLYSDGPITKYIESICKFPLENIPNSSSLAVTKIA